MLLTRHPARRFSLLLLDEGEDYVGGWGAAAAWPVSVAGNWSGAARVAGRLRLASKCLFFEADDARVPIIRIAFSAVQQLESVGKNAIALATNALTQMKANCADAPYVFLKGTVSVWTFTLAHASLHDVLPLVQAQLAMSRLPYSERDDALQRAAEARAEAAAFDSSRLADFTEAVHFNAPATALSPLVSEPGRLVITNARVYFQPAVDWRGDTSIRSAPLAQIAAVVRRTSSLRPVGLELFFMDMVGGGGGGGSGWDAPSAVFAFGSPEKREEAVAKLRCQPALGAALPGGRDATHASASILEAEGGWMQRVTAAWREGRLSNLDYLLYLNLAAGRSFCDLTQWPVAPWVLSDYHSPTLDLADPRSFRDLSKPVGALNPERLAMLRRRFQEMPRDDPQQPPFLYGTHYSCPGYVMFWLVRAAPGHLLRLQNGRFDTADRLFSSVAGAWDSVVSSAPDVKELIPEFYLSSTAFLNNRLQLTLGTRQDGRVVDEVALPPWAASADDFLRQHRAALESPYVSANLHHWLDLIFGYKQRGASADAADNVFHGMTYAGATRDIAAAEPRERRVLEAQVNEFGQCPTQLFTEPHPPRRVSPPWSAPGAAGQGIMGGADDAALSMTVVSTILAVLAAEELSAAASKHADDSSPPDADNCPLGSIAPAEQRSPELVALDVAPLAPHQQSAPASAAQMSAEADIAAPKQHSGGMTPLPVAWMPPDSNGPMSKATGDASGAVATPAAVAPAVADTSTVAASPFAAAHLSLPAEEVPQLTAAQQTPTEAAASGERPPSSAASEGIAGMADHFQGGSGGSKPPLQGGSEQGAERQPSAGRLPRLAGALAAMSPPSIAGMRASATSAASSAGAAAARLPSLRSLFVRTTSSKQTMAGPPDASPNGDAHTAGPQDPPPLDGLSSLSGSSPGSPLSPLSPHESAGAASAFAGAVSGALSSALSRLSPPGLRNSGDRPPAQPHRIISPPPPPLMSVLPGSSAAAAAAQPPSPYTLTKPSHLPPPPPAGYAAYPASTPPTTAQPVLGIPVTHGLGRGSSGGSGSGGVREDRWPGTRVCSRKPLTQQAAPVAALCSAAPAAGGPAAVLCAGQDGCLRATALPSGEQMWEQALGMSALTSVVHHLDTTASAPVLFLGSSDCQVYACSPAGKPAGTWLAHGDAVSTVCSIPGGRLLTASWDGCLRIWDLEEGRQPWATGVAAPTAPKPAVQLGGTGGGIWSAAAAPAPSGTTGGDSGGGGNVIASGGDDGVVSLWDARSGQHVWQAEVSRDYVAALTVLAGGASLVAAAADGRLSLLDARGASPLIAQVACGAPLAACQLAPQGDCVAAGGEDGRLHLWSFADGLRSEALSPTAINSLASVPAMHSGGAPGGAGGGEEATWHLAAGCEDGTIHLIACRS